MPTKQFVLPDEGGNNTANYRDNDEEPERGKRIAANKDRRTQTSYRVY